MRSTGSIVLLQQRRGPRGKELSIRRYILLYKTLLPLTDSLPPSTHGALLITKERVTVRVGEATWGAQMKTRYFKIAAVVLALAVMAAIAVSQTVRRAHMRGDGMFGGPMLGYYVHK